MQKAFEEVSNYATQGEATLRRAAMDLAVFRVADGVSARGGCFRKCYSSVNPLVRAMQEYFHCSIRDYFAICPDCE